jgi:multicomponent Na+:H+ antiporter subunit G
MTSLLADALIVLGLAIMTVGVYGLVRLPDAYTQLHAASKATFLGVALLLVSAAIEGGGALVGRSLLVIGLLTVTTPVAAHAVARAARARAEPMRSPGAVDES